MDNYIAREAATSKTGPNNASGVIWAPGESFFIFLFLLTNIYGIYKAKTMVTTTKRVGIRDEGRGSRRVASQRAPGIYFYINILKF
jgi:hypothetical protein